MEDYLQELFNENLENEEYFYTITDYVLEKESEYGLEGLNELEQKVFLLIRFLMEINNGGFDHYYLETNGIYAKPTLEFLDSMNETSFAKLLDESISIFKAVIPDDKKINMYQELDDKFYHLSPNNYDILYEKFVHFLRLTL